jgi:hypothetical protein
MMKRSFNKKIIQLFSIKVQWLDLFNLQKNYALSNGKVMFKTSRRKSYPLFRNLNWNFESNSTMKLLQINKLNSQILVINIGYWNLIMGFL